MDAPGMRAYSQLEGAEAAFQGNRILQRQHQQVGHNEAN
jgi:hypothetical protein